MLWKSEYFKRFDAMKNMFSVRRISVDVDDKLHERVV